MACDSDDLHDYLANLSDPVDTVICPFVQDAGGGAGMGLPLFSLLFFGLVGLALTIRTQHPGPILVAGLLSAGLVGASIPGVGAKILALVFFFGIIAVGFYIFQRTKSSL